MASFNKTSGFDRMTTPRSKAPTPYFPPYLYGQALLENSVFNKGSAFTEEERDLYGLRGLLPPHVDTLEEQVSRAYGAYKEASGDLQKHIFLRQLQDTNEVLFYRLLLGHIEEMLPIVYTPTVGLACEQFSHIYRRPRGLFISYPNRGNIRKILANRPVTDVDVIVVTDGERILGIGDQGAGGMGIPIGKLSLYTLIGGIHPERTLPIILDVGTNNRERLNDPLYVGWHHERVTGKDYDDFLAEFVEAVKVEMPNVCLQWEDFATAHARPLLDRYRDQLLTFNDDIQGTAAVALGAVLSAVNIKRETLKEQTIVFLGAGSAGVGVADYLRAAMVKQGLSEADARGRFYMVDKDGLLHDGRTDLLPEQRVYAQSVDTVGSWGKEGQAIGLAEVIDRVNATILIGLSTVSGAFTRSIVERMAAKVERPIIFPLSNPTSRSEAIPADLMKWTQGKALVASGSPFEAVFWEGWRKPIAQCNNVYIFPSIGLALVASKARRVTDTMLIAAAEALGKLSPALLDPAAPLLPELRHARDVAVEIALAVARQAIEDGVAPSASVEELREAVMANQWYPDYYRLPL
ncbi:MAG: NAD-linked malate dehydrogenase [Pseudomonadota bacterium]|jgi:malate dehydrogenase (oxaloacetate-decarboxylating)